MVRQYIPKVQIGTIWLGPLEDRAHVLEALNQYHVALKRRRVSLPDQLDSQFQRIADHVEYKLDHGEMMALPDIVDDLLRRCGYGHENTSLFLSALAAGGEVWVWQTKSPGRYRVEHSEGWCVALDGQIAATICYTS
ncbi:hypothetical protein F2P45_00465 [Massilia sp. CCM 8733]|uniref:Uncharacterized protein n=1 Tax=Massilia mucilaginosa TaxID=2609282 RepID=A0ABX0NL47_9BURK|nr:hypothetical protein [Massilia mucilaginosa]NHZ87512.1 hypothetical protein [Massilia mucilaginosa]